MPNRIPISVGIAVGNNFRLADRIIKTIMAYKETKVNKSKLRNILVNVLRKELANVLGNKLPVSLENTLRNVIANVLNNALVSSTCSLVR